MHRGFDLSCYGSWRSAHRRSFASVQPSRTQRQDCYAAQDGYESFLFHRKVLLRSTRSPSAPVTNKRRQDGSGTPEDWNVASSITNELPPGSPVMVTLEIPPGEPI